LRRLGGTPSPLILKSMAARNFAASGGHRGLSALREWAYGRAYLNYDQRVAELPVWLHRCNWHRPHGSLKSHTPISRLRLTEDNVLRLHS
jgi:transposase InsO family protein